METNTIQKVIARRIDSLNQQLSESRRDLLNASPFKIGDKVVYDGKTKYIYTVRIDTAVKGGLIYSLTDLTSKGKFPKRMINGEYYIPLSSPLLNPATNNL